MTYDEIVAGISGFGRTTVECRFSIGQLVGRAIDEGHDLERISADTGFRVATLEAYAHVAAFWGSDRILDCPVWWPYVWVADIDDVESRTELRRIGIEQGRRALDDCRLEMVRERNGWKPPDPVAENDRHADSAVRSLWSAKLELDRIDFSALDPAKRAAVADAARRIVEWAESLRRQAEGRAA